MSKFSPSSELNETAGFLGGLVKQARLAWRLFRDDRVPGWVKMVPFAALIYFFSPIDLIPDMALPGLGEVDDLFVFLLAIKMFLELSPASVVREHLEDLFGMQRNTDRTPEPPTPAIIEGSYQILDPRTDDRSMQDR